MNERIRELAEQSSLSIGYRVEQHTFKHIDDPNGPYTRIEFSKEKFAEMIVRECANICDRDYVRCGQDGDGWRLARDIEQHFGVEE